MNYRNKISKLFEKPTTYIQKHLQQLGFDVDAFNNALQLSDAFISGDFVVHACVQSKIFEPVFGKVAKKKEYIDKSDVKMTIYVSHDQYHELQRRLGRIITATQQYRAKDDRSWFIAIKNDVQPQDIRIKVFFSKYDLLRTFCSLDNIMYNGYNVDMLDKYIHLSFTDNDKKLARIVSVPYSVEIDDMDQLLRMYKSSITYILKGFELKSKLLYPITKMLQRNMKRIMDAMYRHRAQVTFSRLIDCWIILIWFTVQFRTAILKYKDEAEEKIFGNNLFFFNIYMRKNNEWKNLTEDLYEFFASIRFADITNTIKTKFEHIATQSTPTNKQEADLLEVMNIFHNNTWQLRCEQLSSGKALDTSDLQSYWGSHILDDIFEPDSTTEIEKKLYEYRMNGGYSGKYWLMNQLTDEMKEEKETNEDAEVNLMGGTCYDVIELDDINIKEYLEQNQSDGVNVNEDNKNDYIIIVTAIVQRDRGKRISRATKSATTFTRTQINEQLKDTTGIFLPCVNPGKEGFPVDPRVRFVRISLKDQQIYVPINDIKHVVLKKTNYVIFYAEPTHIAINWTASVDATLNSEEGGFVSGDHCQNGTKKVIHRLRPINTCIQSSKTSSPSSTNVRSRKKQRI